MSKQTRVSHPIYSLLPRRSRDSIPWRSLPGGSSGSLSTRPRRSSTQQRIHVIRTNKMPFIESGASWPLILTSVVIVGVGAWLTVSPLAKMLGFVSLPPLYWLFLAITLLGYAILTHVVKTWFILRFGE